MAWDDDKQVAPGTEEGELTPEEWNEHVADQKGHAGRHGHQETDELATALRYEPQGEPETPESGCVRWYDDTADAYKVKFSDGSAITVGEL